MKKIIVLLVISVLTVFQAQAVLKEKDLSQTLGVLRGELQLAYNEQQAIMASFEKRNADQHYDNNTKNIHNYLPFCHLPFTVYFSSCSACSFGSLFWSLFLASST